MTLPRLNSDELLILGSDGLFEYLSDEEVLNVSLSAYARARVRAYTRMRVRAYRTRVRAFSSNNLSSNLSAVC